MEAEPALRTWRVGAVQQDQGHLCPHRLMAIIKNPDGTITVGILPKEQSADKTASAPEGEKAKKTAPKKAAKKK